MEQKIIKTPKEKGETARVVHKSYFDKTKVAIDQGYYLEALCMEYASMEGRMTVIMRELGMDCGIKKTSKDQPDIALKNRLNCLKNFILKNQKTIFAESYFNLSIIKEIQAWIDVRNSTMHGLYNDTEKYELLVSKMKILALKGYDYVYTMYDEANRLKRLMKKHPEYKERIKRSCDHRYKNCVKLQEYLKTGIAIFD